MALAVYSKRKMSYNASIMLALCLLFLSSSAGVHTCGMDITVAYWATYTTNATSATMKQPKLVLQRWKEDRAVMEAPPAPFSPHPASSTLTFRMGGLWSGIRQNGAEPGAQRGV